MDRRTAGIAIVAVAVGAAIAVASARRGSDQGARCGAGFVARAARCLVASEDRAPGAGAVARACPSPLVNGPAGCDAPDQRVLVPAAAIAMGPSDWESEGRVTPRTLHVQAFRIDAFEVTRGRWGLKDDVARAASGMTRDEAAAFCATRGGRLPTEDEWIVAAASAANPPRRYPWGDTGAVCRRAAWGLSGGPCARGSDGPDTVGAHPDGDSPLGMHDLAGNVAEWVAPEPLPASAGQILFSTPSIPNAPALQAPTAASRVLGAGPQNSNGIAAGPQNSNGLAKGGSWASTLAADLRIWARLELPPGARDPRVGLRCAYPP